MITQEFSLGPAGSRQRGNVSVLIEGLCCDMREQNWARLANQVEAANESRQWARDWITAVRRGSLEWFIWGIWTQVSLRSRDKDLDHKGLSNAINYAWKHLCDCEAWNTVRVTDCQKYSLFSKICVLLDWLARGKGSLGLPLLSRLLPCKIWWTSTEM